MHATVPLQHQHPGPPTGATTVEQGNAADVRGIRWLPNTGAWSSGGPPWTHLSVEVGLHAATVLLSVLARCEHREDRWRQATSTAMLRLRTSRGAELGQVHFTGDLYGVFSHHVVLEPVSEAAAVVMVGLVLRPHPALSLPSRHGLFERVPWMAQLVEAGSFRLNGEPYTLDDAP